MTPNNFESNIDPNQTQFSPQNVTLLLNLNKPGLFTEILNSKSLDIIENFFFVDICSYMIMNIQKDENSFDGHAYKHVYTWDNVNKLNRTAIMPTFPNNSSVFNSSCSVECGKGEVKVNPF